MSTCEGFVGEGDLCDFCGLPHDAHEEGLADAAGVTDDDDEPEVEAAGAVESIFEDAETAEALERDVEERKERDLDEERRS